MSRFQIFIVASLMLFIGLAGGSFLTEETSPKLERQAALPPAIITVPSLETPTPRPIPMDARTLGQNFVTISKQIRPAVVSLRTERLVKHPASNNNEEEPLRDFFRRPFNRFFNSPPDEVPQQSMGSGFIVDGISGYILTNHHVVEGATNIDVTLFDNQVLKATLVGSDPKTDLAVIRTYDHEGKMPNVLLGNSDRLEVGEWVIAIGNPFGLNHTVTAGIVSGRGRILNTTNYEDFIQTDAAINPGNSGGPLVDLNGEVIGISTAIASNSGYFQGAGFAIPINQAKTIMEHLIQTGYVARGFIGIRMVTLGPDDEQALGIDKGVVIRNAQPGTPAEKAGLKSRDVIVEFQGQPVEDSARFRNIVASISPGTEVEMKIWRDEAYHDITLTLGNVPGENPPKNASLSSIEELGITVDEVTIGLAKQFGEAYKGGVVVSGIKSGSLADRSGLEAGDLIEEINHDAVTSVDSYHQIVDEIRPGQLMTLLIRRSPSRTRLVTFRKPAE